MSIATLKLLKNAEFSTFDVGKPDSALKYLLGFDKADAKSNSITLVRGDVTRAAKTLESQIINLKNDLNAFSTAPFVNANQNAPTSEEVDELKKQIENLSVELMNAKGEISTLKQDNLVLKGENEKVKAGKFDELIKRNLTSQAPVDSVERNRQSYASMTKPKPSQHVVIVKPKDQNKVTDSQNTYSYFRSKLDFETLKEKKIRLLGRKEFTSNKRVIVHCDSEDSCAAICETLKEDENITVSKPKGRKSRIIVFGIDKGLTDEQISENIIDRNDQLLEHADSISFLGSKVDRKGNKFALIETTEEVHGLILSLPGLFIMHTRCNVANYKRRIIFCFKCQEAGHISKDCPNETHCGKCDADHETKDCHVPATEFKCTNCTRINIKRKQRHQSEFPTDHQANDAQNCPSFKSLLKKLNHNE